MTKLQITKDFIIKTIIPILFALFESVKKSL